MATQRQPSRGVAFPPRVGDDGRIAWSQGPNNIRESIRIILSTEPGERLMLPRFGGGLRRFLFEPNTAATRRLIQERITQALDRWEPRIKVESVAVAEDPDDPATANVTIHYTLVSSGSREHAGLSLRLAGTDGP